jgi:hypothetical protein
MTAASEAAILAATQASPPGQITRWSTRRLARRWGVSQVTVMRSWHKVGVQPHRLKRYLTGPDPDFEARAKEILGLYLHATENVAVFCIYGKTVIQGPEPGQPALPLRLEHTEPHTAGCLAHGTVSLFAALAAQRGNDPGRCAPRPGGKALVEFLDEAVAGQRRRMIHVILDNLTAAMPRAVKAWAATHPRVRFHLAPNYASWLNQVEIWFGMVTRDCLRRGMVHSMPELSRQIMKSIRLYNRYARPFGWT